jgi:hypothetical protein
MDPATLARIVFTIITSRVGLGIFLSIFLWFGYHQTVGRFFDLLEENKNLQKELEQSTLLCEQVATKYASMLAACESAAAERQKSYDANIRLHKKLERPGKKGIGEIGNKKPILLERAINYETKRLQECLEQITKGEICVN